MATMENTAEKNIDKGDSGKMVHYVLSHSYMIYMGAIVLGMVTDSFVKFNLFKLPHFIYIGVLCMALGTLLVYWAQKTSSCSKKKMEKEGGERDFARGPYKYSRNPTHIGLSILTLGFGFMVGSISIVIFMVVAFLVTKFIFLRKEENLLEEKYGQIYCEYKSKVNPWL